MGDDVKIWCLPILFINILSSMLQLKEELMLTQHTFYLAKQHPETPNSPIFTYDFAPITCRKTYKLIRTVPTYQRDDHIGFATEAHPLTKSLNLIRLQKQSHSCIMIAKPSNNYCQVCRESYEDYLKHIAHPLHKNKLQLSDKSFSFTSIKSILQKQKKKAKKLTWNFEGQKEEGQEGQENVSLGLVQQSDARSVCSKKRFIQKEVGSIQSISVASSTGLEEMEFQREVKPRSAKRKYSNFRQIHAHHNY